MWALLNMMEKGSYLRGSGFVASLARCMGYVSVLGFKIPDPESSKGKRSSAFIPPCKGRQKTFTSKPSISRPRAERLLHMINMLLQSLKLCFVAWISGYLPPTKSSLGRYVPSPQASSGRSQPGKC